MLFLNLSHIVALFVHVFSKRLFLWQTMQQTLFSFPVKTCKELRSHTLKSTLITSYLKYTVGNQKPVVASYVQLACGAPQDFRQVLWKELPASATPCFMDSESREIIRYSQICFSGELTRHQIKCFS